MKHLKVAILSVILCVTAWSSFASFASTPPSIRMSEGDLSIAGVKPGMTRREANKIRKSWQDVDEWASDIEFNKQGRVRIVYGTRLLDGDKVLVMTHKSFKAVKQTLGQPFAEGRVDHKDFAFYRAGQNGWVILRFDEPRMDRRSIAMHQVALVSDTTDVDTTWGRSILNQALAAR